MWKPLANVLAPHYTVIVPDLPGIGNSSIPAAGLDMTTSARRIRGAVRSIGYGKVRVVGHDIGLMVAYAYAAMYPQQVERLALMDAFLPGVPGWEAIYNNPKLWHFRFHGPAETLPGWRPTYVDLDLSPLIPTITAPALLLWGDADEISPVAVGRHLAACFREPGS
jgi:pimeloyl-ACP methyl ester carboxylesterase